MLEHTKALLKSKTFKTGVGSILAGAGMAAAGYYTKDPTLMGVGAIAVLNGLTAIFTRTAIAKVQNPDLETAVRTVVKSVLDKKIQKGKTHDE